MKPPPHEGLEDRKDDELEGPRMKATVDRASRIALIAIVLAVLSLLATGSLFAAGAVAIAAQVAAAMLMLWARVTFGLRSFHAAASPTEGGLVTTGPYRFIRHPIYASVLLFLVAGVTSHLSVLSLLLGAIAAAGLSVRIAAEERLVIERYPEYADYAARTKRLVPFVF
jgi:protein-S-isoprenylcysteine O-methyltransferase Ste14